MEHSILKEQLLKEYNSNINGLTSREVINRIKLYGYNELPEKKNKNIIRLFLEELISPLEIILIITAILSFIIGEVFDGFVLIFIILVDVIIGTLEEYRAIKSADNLLNMIKVTSKVFRDNQKLVVDSKTLVKGDIVLLESGDKVVIDGRILESNNLTINESSLTGESLDVYKYDTILDENVRLSDRINMVYAGTSVTRGRAKVIVTNTGINTEIGKIADRVTNTLEEKSPLEIRMKKFTKQIGIMIILIALIITFILLKKNYSFDVIFLSVITLSVSALPEGLSLALTMSLTIAARKMCKKNVIVKNLNAVEALGSCTVIATDKTGTLTVNEQTAKEVILKNGSRYLIGGTGYNDIGNIECFNNNIDDLKYISHLGLINNEAKLEFNDKWEFFGDSIDIAFLSLAKKLKLENNYEIIKIIPYESENRYSAVFYKKDNKIYCTVKGSLEKIMNFSENNNNYINYNNDLSSRGYRVIAIADGIVNSTNIENISNLNFVGMVGFIDPVREGVKKSIEECINAGIKVVMITGDHPITAFSIGKELNLCSKLEEVATSVELEKYKKLGENDYDKYVSNIKVFARVTPIDKLEIVESFKRQKEFVAVTGDGVNDAPAIKTASIGISMGSGTDVAKETSSMIITNDSFTSIAIGVKEGRIAYNNIRNIILFLISCGIAEVLFFLLSIVFNYDLPLLAIQLLWLNLVTDGLQDIALSFEKNSDNVMKEKPRKTRESLFSKDLILEVLILGLTISLIVFGVWKYLMDKNVDIVIARSVVMMLMVIIQNINVLNCRSEKNSIFKTSLKDNPLIIFVIIGSILLQLLISYIPFTAKIFKIVPLSLLTTLKVFGLSFTIIIVFEIYKLIRKKIYNNYY